MEDHVPKLPNKSLPSGRLTSFDRFGFWSFKKKNFYSIITRIQSEILSIKFKNPPNIYLKVFDTILNFYTTVEYNECKYYIATLLFTESDTLCLLN